MKNTKILAAMFALVALVTGCGMAQQNPAATNINPQTGLPYNQNPGVYTNGVTNGCAPLANGQIPFSAQGATVNNSYLLAGQLPASYLHQANSYGTVAIGGGFGAGGVMLVKQSSMGTLQINVGMQNAQVQNTQFPQTQYPQTTQPAQTGNVSGILQLSQQAVQSIMSQFGYMAIPGQNNMNTICVRSLGIYTVHQVNPAYNNMQTTGQIFGALIYLYINSIPNPIPIQL